MDCFVISYLKSTLHVCTHTVVPFISVGVVKARSIDVPTYSSYIVHLCVETVRRGAVGI